MFFRLAIRAVSLPSSVGLRPGNIEASERCNFLDSLVEGPFPLRLEERDDVSAFFRAIAKITPFSLVVVEFQRIIADDGALATLFAIANAELGSHLGDAYACAQPLEELDRDRHASHDV